MSKTSKMVFVAFMQHYIQSTVTHFVTHVKGVEGVKYYVLYSVYRAPRSPRREGYLKRIPSCGFSGSPSQSEKQLC